jgi:transaldolase
MKLFIDTADVKQIREVASWGILDGVTTNPTHVAKAVAETGRKVTDVYAEICDITDGPVSLEAVSLTAPEIVAEGRKLAKIGRNVVVKVPLLKEGLKAVKLLAAEGLRTNVTVTFSPLQAMLAGKCGATYISPFIGRLDAVGHFGMELVRQTRAIYLRYGFATQVLAAAVRHPLHVLEAALAGADACTMPYDVMAALYQHPLTDLAVGQFLQDWAQMPQEAR